MGHIAGVTVCINCERHLVDHVLVGDALDIPRSPDRERNHTIIVGGLNRFLGVLIGDSGRVIDANAVIAPVEHIPCPTDLDFHTTLLH